MFSQTLTFLEAKAEFDAIACERDIFNCFRLLLGRYPSRAEWEGHSARAGETLASVVSIYADSSEREKLSRLNNAPELVEMNGFSLFASQNDLAVGKHILARREYEPHLSRVFARIICPGMRVLDIGANIGYYTFLAASLVGPGGKVWAVEPNRKNVTFLLASRARNGYDHVEIIQAAASDRWEVLSLFTDCSNGAALPPQAGEPADFQEPVLALPLRACLAGSQRMDVLKIDVEGAEGKALRGMLELIERHRPVVFSEFTPSALPLMSGISPAEYLEMFTSRGYSLAVLTGDGPSRMAAQQLLEHTTIVAPDSHVDFLAEPLP